MYSKFCMGVANASKALCALYSGDENRSKLEVAAADMLICGGFLDLIMVEGSEPPTFDLKRKVLVVPKPGFVRCLGLS